MRIPFFSKPERKCLFTDDLGIETVRRVRLRANLGTFPSVKGRIFFRSLRQAKSYLSEDEILTCVERVLNAQLTKKHRPTIKGGLA